MSGNGRSGTECKEIAGESAEEQCKSAEKSAKKVAAFKLYLLLILDEFFNVMDDLLFKKKLFIVYIIAWVLLATTILTLPHETKKEEDFVVDFVNKVIALIEDERDFQSESDNLDDLLEKIKIIYHSTNRKSDNKLGAYDITALLEDAYTKCLNIKHNISIKQGDFKPRSKCDILFLLVQKSKEVDPLYGLSFEQRLIFENLEKDLRKCSCEAIEGYVNQLKEIIRSQNKSIEQVQTQRLINWLTLVSSVVSILGFAPIILAALSWLYKKFVRPAG